MPWLGAISVSAPGSARRRTESENGPVALMTTRAPIVHCLAGFLVGCDDAVDETVRPFRDADDARVVDESGALFDRGLRQVDQQPCIVELTVVVDDARRAARQF